MARLPEGTITFMLTDLQGSTEAWEKKPKAMRTAMARHDAILAGVIRDHEGQRVEAGREGDSVLAVFRTAATAAACALDIEKNFASEPWPEGFDLKVRVALHTGEAQLREGHYFGPALNRCARLLATCHPGQILLTKAVESMLADEVPSDAELQDLGVHRLKDLGRPEQVFQLNHMARTTKFPPIRSLPQQQTNMPHSLTSFVGRQAELSALKSLLANSRMVTLTGAGGSGKTRLAAELGWACLNLWPGGVWWVDLTPLNDPEQVPSAVVAALELPGRRTPFDVVTAWLAARRTILVLDNCEHLVAACARFCEATLQRCPGLTIVSTSREGLGVSGEARWPVSSMAATDAVELFEARARLVVPDFKVMASDAGAVTQICERLDGMPLAIELAAARVGMMSVPEILGQLADRFRLLTGGIRTAPDRQLTMVATIDWSYRLLSERERLLFCRLSVFRGGFTLESAQAVCADAGVGAVLDELTGLVQKSMVVAERAKDSNTRYRLLESQLAYAEDRLRDTGELEPMRRRHCVYFRDSLAASRSGPGGTVWNTVMASPMGVANMPTSGGAEFATRQTGRPIHTVTKADWIRRESANLWAALDWARNNADDLGLSLAVDIEFRDVTQARTVLADLLAHSPEQGVLRARALTRAAFLAWNQGDYQAALQAAESGVALFREFGDAERTGAGLNHLGMAEWTAAALNQLGAAHQSQGQLAEAARAYEEATILLKDCGGPAQMAVIRNSIGILEIYKGNYPAAAAILTEVVATQRAEGELWFMSAAIDSLACAQLGLHDYPAAAANWRESLAICRRLEDDSGVVGCLDGLSCVAGGRGDDERALRLAAAAKRISNAGPWVPDGWLLRQVEESQGRSRSRLGTRKSEEAWNQGWAMTLDQAVDYTLGEGEPETAIDAGPLSRREREVAILVAAGLTNRQIAERLFIAERSAEGHLERIRNKLGVRSRTEVATWAVEHGLMPASIKERGTPDGSPSTQRRKPG